MDRVGTETPGPLIVIGNAWGADATDCVIDDASGACRSLDDVNACADAECLGSRDNVALAAGAATAPTVDAIDVGAPSSIAMDRDGDCRGATGIDAGADELP